MFSKSSHCPHTVSEEDPNVITYSTSSFRQWKNVGVVPDLFSNYGIQMASFDEIVVGVGTKTDNSLVITTKAAGDENWATPTAMPALYKALGRVAVASVVSETKKRLYVAYRGTNDGVYLVFTEDLKEWTDLGRVGSNYAKSKVAPALCSFLGYKEDRDHEREEDKMLLAGVGEDKYIYYTVLDENGEREKSWTKMPGTGTQSALSAVTDFGRDNVTLFHTGYNNGAFFSQTYSSKDGKWTDLKKANNQDIRSGPAAFNKGDFVGVAYIGKEDDIPEVTYQSGNDWTPGREISPVPSLYQLGVCTHYSNEESSVYISVPARRDDELRYRFPLKMSEKGISISEKEVQEWDCKWQEKEEKKCMLQKFFCC